LDQVERFLSRGIPAAEINAGASKTCSPPAAYWLSRPSMSGVAPFADSLPEQWATDQIADQRHTVHERKPPKGLLCSTGKENIIAGRIRETGLEKGTMPDFSLRKWYLDVADDQGGVFIGYCLFLKWGHFELNGLQHLWRSPKGIETQTDITGQSAPCYERKDRLVWKPRGLEGIWDSVEEPVKATLLDVEEGKIEWQCTQPKARARVNSPRLSLSGWGYTERIDITIPIWKLPFETLYWGRCHTDNHYLVWIKLEGGTKQDLIWFDGKCSHDLVIQAERIVGPDFVLELGEFVRLREGRIGSTILQPFRNITRILPKTILSLDERKWYSRGILHTKAEVEPAIVIYERVSW
jgi:hypothetical protein